MKKILGILLSLLVLTSCNQNQQSGGNKKYSIGINQFAQHQSLNNCREGLIEGLKSEGIEEGKNLTIDYNNADADVSIANQIGQKLASGKNDLLVSIATPSAMATYNAAMDKDIPLVYTAITDPVEAKLANEDKSPTGNVTGTSDELPVEAQLKTIREILPEAKNLGILYTSSESSSVSTIKIYEKYAKDYGFNLVAQAVTQSSDIPMATDSILSKVDVMTNILDNNVVNSLPLILDKANAKKIPVFGSEIEQVKLGCIAAEGLDYLELGKQTGIMAAKILKGEIKASETKYEIFKNPNLYINKSTFKNLGIELTDKLSQRAVESFE